MEMKFSRSATLDEESGLYHQEQEEGRTVRRVPSFALLVVLIVSILSVGIILKPDAAYRVISPANFQAVAQASVQVQAHTLSATDAMSEEDYTASLPSEAAVITGDQLPAAEDEIFDPQPVSDADMPEAHERESSIDVTSVNPLPHQDDKTPLVLPTPVIDGLFDPRSVKDEEDFIAAMSAALPPKNDVNSMVPVINDINSIATFTDANGAASAATGEPSPALFCPFAMYKRSASYTPPTGCALISEDVPAYMKKGKKASSFVVCAPENLGGVAINEPFLHTLSMIDTKGRSTISYIYPGPSTTLDFFEGDSVDGASYTFINSPGRGQDLSDHELESKKSVNDNVKSLMFKSSAVKTPASCEEVYSEMRINQKDTKHL